MSAQAYGAVSFKVTTEVLKQQSTEVKKRIDNVKRLFNELAGTIQSTRSYWIGEAGNVYRQAYENRKDDLNEMFRRLEEHPVDLLQIAGIYEEGERAVTESFTSLREDIIR